MSNSRFGQWLKRRLNEAEDMGSGDSGTMPAQTRPTTPALGNAQGEDPEYVELRGQLDTYLTKVEGLIQKIHMKGKAQEILHRVVKAVQGVPGITDYLTRSTVKNTLAGGSMPDAGVNSGGPPH